MLAVELLRCGVIGKWCTQKKVGECGECPKARRYLKGELRKIKDVPAGSEGVVQKLNSDIMSGSIFGPDPDGALLVSKLVNRGVVE